MGTQAVMLAIAERQMVIGSAIEIEPIGCRKGGLIAIGVPGFNTLPVERTASRLARILSRLGVSQAALDAMDASTLTLRTHNFPGDFYRFSPQAVTEVLLDGLLDKEVHTLMLPPRIIGVGIKPPMARS